ncbi:MAG: hypothetical protein N3B21_04115 [Clostridia bacterium]|nr:hypothetical protein [Clostridia bacterium]
MHEKRKNAILKIAALIGVISFFYPSLMVLRVWLYKTDGGIGGFAFYFAMMLGGFIAGTAIIKDDEYKFIREPAAYMAVIAPIVITLAVFSGSGWERMIFETIFIIIFYMVGLRGFITTYGDILNTARICLGVVCIIIPLILARYFDVFKYLSTLFFVFAYTSIVISFIVKNQQILERFIDKSANSSIISWKIRRYNVGLVLIIFLGIILLINAKGLVLMLFSTVGSLIQLAGRLCYMLIGLVVGGGTSTNTDKGADVSPLLFDFMREEDSVKALDPFTELIYNIIGYFIIMCLAYVVLSILFKNIKSFYKVLYRYFKNFLKAPSADGMGICGDYADETETVEEPKNNNQASSMSKQGKSKNSISRRASPSDKVRYLYSNIIYVLTNKNINIKESDTTGEIYIKSLKIKGIEQDLKELTCVYDNVRYGDKLPTSGEIVELEHSCSRINHVLKEWRPDKEIGETY